MRERVVDVGFGTVFAGEVFEGVREVFFGSDLAAAFAEAGRLEDNEAFGFFFADLRSNVFSGFIIVTSATHSRKSDWRSAWATDPLHNGVFVAEFL
jgi:hypothetical protein